MSDQFTIEERVTSLEAALRTAIIFNMNAAGAIGRRLASGNDAIANAIGQDLAQLKLDPIESVDKQLYDQYVDSLIQLITGRG